MIVQKHKIQTPHFSFGHMKETYSKVSTKISFNKCNDRELVHGRMPLIHSHLHGS